MLKKLRQDANKWQKLLNERGITSLWHFAPLHCLPSIVLQGRLISIDQANQLKLKVPTRQSRMDDIQKGVGDYIKLSTRPYWNMLSKILRTGEPHIFLEFSTLPIMWNDTSFGNGNIWLHEWQRNDSYDFVSRNVFIGPSREIFPEIYVKTELVLEGTLKTVYTILQEESDLLNECLKRLELKLNVPIFAAGWSRPFPDAPKNEYLANRPNKFERDCMYLNGLTLEDLKYGVTICE